MEMVGIYRGEVCVSVQVQEVVKKLVLAGPCHPEGAPGAWKEAVPCSDPSWQQVVIASNFPIIVGSSLDSRLVMKTCELVVVKCI